MKLQYCPAASSKATLVNPCYPNTADIATHWHPTLPMFVIAGTENGHCLVLGKHRAYLK